MRVLESRFPISELFLAHFYIHQNILKIYLMSLAFKGLNKTETQDVGNKLLLIPFEYLV